MKVSALVVRSFYGSKRKVVGEVDLPIGVEPYLFTITFQMMDTNPGYSFLLGISWIHNVGEVISTQQQKLKFMFEDILVIICGEEDLIVSELSLFQYINTEEGITEVPFHFLEFEDGSSATSV